MSYVTNAAGFIVVTCGAEINNFMDTNTQIYAFGAKATAVDFHTVTENYYAQGYEFRGFLPETADKNPASGVQRFAIYQKPLRFTASGK